MQTLQRVKVRIARKDDEGWSEQGYLCVTGTVVNLGRGPYFCPIQSIPLSPQRFLDLEFEDMQWDEYGYPQGVEESLTQLGLKLEPIGKVIELGITVNAFMLIGWFLRDGTGSSFDEKAKRYAEGRVQLKAFKRMKDLFPSALGLL